MSLTVYDKLVRVISSLREAIAGKASKEDLSSAVSKVMGAVGERLTSDVLFPAFSDGAEYAKGDAVFRDGKLVRCVVGGKGSDAVFRRTTVSEIISMRADDLSSSVSGVSETVSSVRSRVESVEDSVSKIPQSVTAKGVNPCVVLDGGKSRVLVSTSGVTSYGEGVQSSTLRYPSRSGTAALLEDLGDPWRPDSAYREGMLCVRMGKAYMCSEAHTSGKSFDPDMKAGRWTDRFTVGAIIDALADALSSAVANALPQKGGRPCVPDLYRARTVSSIMIPVSSESQNVGRVFFTPENVGARAGSSVTAVRILNAETFAPSQWDHCNSFGKTLYAHVCALDRSSPESPMAEGTVVAVSDASVWPDERSDYEAVFLFPDSGGSSPGGGIGAVFANPGDRHFIAFSDSRHDVGSVLADKDTIQVSMRLVFGGVSSPYDGCFCDGTRLCPRISFDILPPYDETRPRRTVRLYGTVSGSGSDPSGNTIFLPLPDTDESDLSNGLEVMWSVMCGPETPGGSAVDFESGRNAFALSGGDGGAFGWSSLEPNSVTVFTFSLAGETLDPDANGVIRLKRLWTVSRAVYRPVCP